MTTVVKWINCLNSTRFNGGTTMYHAGYRGGIELVSNRISDAILYDMKYFAEKMEGYTLIPITKKQLFKAKLKGK